MLKPTTCLLIMAQKLLVAFSHLHLYILQKSQARINFEWSFHTLLHEWEGTSNVVRTQINFTLKTLSTHVRWYAYHQESAAHLEHLIDLYENLKEGPLALLDEVSKFKDKYIYGCKSSDEDEELSTLRKPDIEGRIAHLKDKAKAASISLRGKDPLAKELQSLRVARAKIEARLA